MRLTPGRIARLFGARETMAELHVREVRSGPESWDDGSLRWRFVATDRDVHRAQHGEMILLALERVPVAAPTPGDRMRIRCMRGSEDHVVTASGPQPFLVT